ncbi:MAG: peptidoglycan-binding domain-containing protein [Desertimonas sp.]
MRAVVVLAGVLASAPVAAASPTNPACDPARIAVEQMGMPRPLVARVVWGCSGMASTQTAQIVPGDSGDRVRSLQQELVDRGATIDVDGHFGPGTEAALVEAQAAAFLIEADGYAGPATQAALGIGDATRSSFATADEFVAWLTTWVYGGADTGLAPDATSALAPAVESDRSVATWTVDQLTAGQRSGDRRIQGFVLAGPGGVYAVMDVCVTETSSIRWCGIWFLRPHW